MAINKEIEMVKSFYEQSFDQLSKFHEISILQISQLYQNSYYNFLEIVVILGSVIGFVVTFGLWWLKKDTKKRLIKIEEKYEKKLDEELKKFQEEFEKKTKTLEVEVYILEAKSFLYQGIGSPNVGLELVLYSAALKAALKSEKEGIISLVLDRIIDSLKKAKKDSFGNVNGFEILEDELKKLILFKEGKEGAIVTLINQVEEEFKKAKERE